MRERTAAAARFFPYPCGEKCCRFCHSSAGRLFCSNSGRSNRVFSEPGQGFSINCKCGEERNICRFSIEKDRERIAGLQQIPKGLRTCRPYINCCRRSLAARREKHFTNGQKNCFTRSSSSLRSVKENISNMVED